MSLTRRYVEVAKEPELDKLGRRKRPLDSERHLAIAANEPWKELGMSRRTWYRRGLHKTFKPKQ